MIKPSNYFIRVVMGSKNDWPVMKNACKVLKEFEISYDSSIVSAHRTPTKLTQFAKESEKMNCTFFIAGAGGSAHLPGMLAAFSPIPVIGVPISSKELNGLDSLLSIVQMPYGIPVGTTAIGVAGAKNAALLIVSILSNQDDTLKKKYHRFRAIQTKKVLQSRIK
ncbi:MAG: 5-(carboxyamino)imidazole ribonucleotide mutase [Methylacidiphilales bacterium]|nr:5-(carboxyamino)imidazole ribonucleotide mutase [Candidatus Methylacidiphilales bacterium]